MRSALGCLDCGALLALNAKPIVTEYAAGCRALKSLTQHSELPVCSKSHLFKDLLTRNLSGAGIGEIL